VPDSALSLLQVSPVESNQGAYLCVVFIYNLFTSFLDCILLVKSIKTRENDDGSQNQHLNDDKWYDSTIKVNGSYLRGTDTFQVEERETKWRGKERRL
jgi:hypothetical protein